MKWAASLIWKLLKTFVCMASVGRLKKWCAVEEYYKVWLWWKLIYLKSLMTLHVSVFCIFLVFCSNLWHWIAVTVLLTTTESPLAVTLSWQTAIEEHCRCILCCRLEALVSHWLQRIESSSVSNCFALLAVNSLIYHSVRGFRCYRCSLWWVKCQLSLSLVTHFMLVIMSTGSYQQR